MVGAVSAEQIIIDDFEDGTADKWSGDIQAVSSPTYEGDYAGELSNKDGSFFEASTTDFDNKEDIVNVTYHQNYELTNNDVVEWELKDQDGEIIMTYSAGSDLSGDCEGSESQDADEIGINAGDCVVLESSPEEDIWYTQTVSLDFESQELTAYLWDENDNLVDKESGIDMGFNGDTSVDFQDSYVNETEITNNAADSNSNYIDEITASTGEDPVNFSDISPEDGSEYGYSTVDFEHTVEPQSDSIDITGIEIFYPNGTLWKSPEEYTDPEPLEPGETHTYTRGINFNESDQPEGDYTWRARADNLTADETYFSENRTLTIDADAAEITFSNLEPSDNSIFDVNDSVDFNAEVEAPEGNNMDDAKIDWYGLEEGSGEITPSSSYTNSVTVSGSESFSDAGSYEWYATAQPEGGSYQDSETRSFEVEAATPDIEWNEPDDGETFTYPFSEDNTDVDVSWSIESYSENGTTALYRNDSEIQNETFSEYSSTTYTETDTLEKGTYEYYTVVETETHTEESDPVTITVEQEDAEPPEVSTSKPEEEDVYEYGPDENSETITFEWSVESFDEDGDTQLYLNDSEIESDTFESFSSNAYSHDEALENGTYEFYAVAETDSYTEETDPVTFKVEVDEDISFADTIIKSVTGFFESINKSLQDNVGEGGLMAFAFIFSIIAAVLVMVWTGSNALSLTTLISSILVFWSFDYVIDWVVFLVALMVIGLVAGKISRHVAGGNR